VRRHAGTEYAVVVCLSQVGILLKRLNVGSRKQPQQCPRGSMFSDAEGIGKTEMGSSPMEAPNPGWVG